MSTLAVPLSRSNRWLSGLLMSLVTVVGSVSCQHIAGYSPVTESMATRDSSELHDSLTSLQGKSDSERTFPASRAFYDDYSHRLGAFHDSEQQKKKNDKTVQMLANIRTAVTVWRDQHQSAVPSTGAIGIVQTQMDALWHDVLVLERAKPR
jgi:hypothetical protein